MIFTPDGVENDSETSSVKRLPVCRMASFFTHPPVLLCTHPPVLPSKERRMLTGAMKNWSNMNQSNYILKLFFTGCRDLTSAIILLFGKEKDRRMSTPTHSFAVKSLRCLPDIDFDYVKDRDLTLKMKRKGNRP